MQQYTQDNSLFEKIDNEQKAYWLGFLYADGCVYKCKDKNSISITIELHPKDKYILDIFIKHLKSDRKVMVNSRGYVRLEIHSYKMGTDLIRLGCVPRKSTILKFPTKDIVPEKLLNHFIRGYLDGDGCISFCKRKRKDKKCICNICEIKFIGTYDMLFGIKQYFKSEKNVLINKHSPKSCQISFTGKKYRNFVDSLYKDATVYLKRKKDTWDRYVAYLDSKYKVIAIESDEILSNKNKCYLK